ncbi:MAG: 16S rRNA (uracil(1498)-N(3))-methyltransferase [Pseudomonadota bacterium]
MDSYRPRTRLYVPVAALEEGAAVSAGHAHAHHLRAVLRAQVGDAVEIFNGKDGAFGAEITALAKAAVQLRVLHKVAGQERLPPLTLAFAVLKKERTQMVVEKVTELGAAVIIPFTSARSQGQALKQLSAEKLQAYVIQACEQCGRTSLPSIAPAARFADILAHEGQLLYADEIQAGTRLSWPQSDGPVTLMIGPEGGWAPEERSALEAAPHAHPITLGPRILRAETAAIAALSLWQQTHGDW